MNLSRRAVFWILRLRTAKPPISGTTNFVPGDQRITMRISLLLRQRQALLIQSIALMTVIGILRVHIAKMGIAEKVELTSVSLPAIENQELMALSLLSTLVMRGR
jgi:hypothetical protein